MEYGYHHASFRYVDDPDGRPLIDSMIDRAHLLEDAGFEWLSLMDHFWQLAWTGELDDDFVECYAGLSALATATEDLLLSGLVTCVHYRNPAYLAKLVASLDQLSTGRAVLGIGAGWYDDEYDAIGERFPPADERIRELRDVIRLCRTAWNSPSPVTYEGEFHQLDDLLLEPKPGDIPVLVGGGGEDLTLRLTAEYADWWNVPGTDPETYAHKLDVLRDHCEAVGRDYDEIRKTVTLGLLLRDDADTAHADYEAYAEETAVGPGDREDFRGLVGTPAGIAETIAAYRELGVDVVQVQPVHNERRSLVRFVDDVVPAV